MPIRSRPIRPDLLTKDNRDSLKSARLADLKKFNFSYLYADNGIDVLNFSFFGDPASSLDYTGASSNLLYGRIDPSGDAIAPRLDVLDTVGSGNSTKFALNFVAQAFNQFQARFTAERSGRNVLKIRESNYRGLSPTRAFTNVNNLHTDLLEDAYRDLLLPYLVSATVSTTVTSFHHFLQLFLGKFVPDVMLGQANLPLLRSNFAISNASTPLISGMIIEISDVDHNNDAEKFSEWLNSRAYSVIKDGAANHGFIIDKHAPWRFIANLNSPRMLNFIQGKGLLQDTQKPSRLSIGSNPFQANDVFNRYYEKMYFKDIMILKNTVLNFYNNYATLKKYASYPAMPKCGLGPDEAINPPMIVRTKQRQKYTLAQLEKDYDDNFWLNQYLILRLLEGNVRLNEERLYKQFRKISQINNYLGYNRALTYVNEYAKMYTGISPIGVNGVQSVGRYAFGKTSNPQVTGIAKSIQPLEETVEQ
jgi:hypothetical protein